MRLKEVKKYLMQRFEQELPDDLHYHSIVHVLDVLQSARRLADAEGIDTYEKDLLATAVLFHDSGFMYQMNQHEERSCDVARSVLPDYGYTPLEIERVCGMIMATRIPQTPGNKLEEIICDADLDYLGRDDFWFTGNKLFEEMKAFGLLSEVKEWNTLQVKFLEAHRYFTATAKETREMAKEAHLTEIKQTLTQHDKG